MSLLRGVDRDGSAVRVDRRRSSARHQCAVLYFLFFVMGTEGFLMPPILPALAADLDISIALAAATSTAFVVTYAVFGPPLGVLSDIRPKRQPVLAGMALFAISNIGVGLAQNFPQMLLARTLMGFAAAVALPAAWAHLSDICPPPRRGRAITNGFAVYGFGQVVGVPLGAFATQVFGWRLPYLAIGVGFVAVLGWAVRTIDTRAPRETAVRWSNMVRPLAVPVVCLALAATFAVQAGRLGAFTYVGALLESRFGFDVAARGLVGALVGVTVIVGSLLSGALVDRQRRGGHHEGWITVAGALFFAAAVALAAGTTTLWIFVLALTMWCLAGGLSYSAQQAYLADVRPAARTTVVAWHSTVMNVGHAAGNTALGSVAIGGTAFAAIAAGFGVLGAALAVAVVLLHRLRRPGDR
ncbi:MFS transporter [Nocardia goodfellowii]|uniref:DHA1 family inner membrane transport protein n=1 Tax=Nocardia goodfellowii TaxID=882446 RepID=A0ABS4QJK6_9NOCA|nr:MFS transporter [Nocardia goodfellowii]MBP2191300.1 DHA1 family inner membrane transport protein [Nocardia goodfellowii]